MSLPEIAIQRSKLTNFIVALILIGGTLTYFKLGRLEDPNFTVKTGVIFTVYPGASANEVELEVTDKIEKAIQELPQLDNLYSLSKPGLSIIKVDIKQSFSAKTLPQVWDEMRKKIRDIKQQLPASVLAPEIMDDFSFVYGFVLGITGEGYSPAELEEYADQLKKELSLVPGVSRAELWGVQPKVVYLDISESKLAKLGISSEAIISTLSNQNFVVRAGSVNIPGTRLRVEVKGEFGSPQDIGELLVRRSFLDNATKALSNELQLENKGIKTPESELIRIKDVAEVKIGYLNPPINQMTLNGKPSLALSLANVEGGNIIKTGKALEHKLEELSDRFPAGIEFTKFQWQSDIVETSINEFIISLAEAILIVLVVLTLAMGWRMGVIIGSGLILTILATFIAMSLMGIELHRVSLGALVVALGMMVDNSIVVADGVIVRLTKGVSPKKAAIESASIPTWPLLGATIIASMAFYPVFSAQSDAGEYSKSLFTVVGVSMIISWFLSITVTPLHCLSILKAPKKNSENSENSDQYDSFFFRAFKNLLALAIRKRFLTIFGSTLLLIWAAYSFKDIPRQFFPNSTRAQFIIDFWAPEGTPIQTVAQDLKDIEEKLLADPRTADIGSFIGSGGPRFYLPVDPEFPYQSYAQTIVNTPSFAEVDPLSKETEAWLNKKYPHILTRVRKYAVGTGDTWPFELRITGPANASRKVLRECADQVQTILHKTPLAKHVRVDMRQQVQKVVIDYSQERARWLGISRHNIAAATLRGHDGLPIGIYRELDDTYPIIARSSKQEREGAANSIDLLQVQPSLSTQTVPLAEVVDKINLEWEDPILARWNRRPQIAIQAQPNGVTFPALRAEVIEEINSIKLPPGYQFEWDGEYKSTNDAQISLIPGLAPTLVIILLIIVGLFNSYKAPIIMFCAIPYALIGISAILVPTQTPFGFIALLGAMSLVGMMIKNSIVLLDEINLNINLGQAEYMAVFNAAVSRLRPVVLAALTTVLGVVPLLQDVFWVSMAMTIMAGLTVGTAVTMIIVPVFYCTLNKVKAT
jgi:multidrug efflux pump subunit AcrB